MTMIGFDLAHGPDATVVSLTLSLDEARALLDELDGMASLTERLAMLRACLVHVLGQIPLTDEQVATLLRDLPTVAG